MKNVIVGGAVALLLVMGNGDPMAVMQAWGLTGYQSKIVPAGAVIKNSQGLVIGVCEKWMVHGCVDLVGIKY